MPTIHHAVVKSAAAKGVILSYDEGSHSVTAHRPEPNRRVELEVQTDVENAGPADLTETARDAWNALDSILAFEQEPENAGIRIEQEDGDFVAFKLPRGDDNDIARDPDLDDLFVSVREALDEQPEDADDDEPEVVSVVPVKYKRLYAERGNPSHCGDWLAETLATLCRVSDGKKEVTDLDRLEAIANANDVAPNRYGKLGLVSNGWQGRFRMTVRNLLTPRVAAKGFLFVPEGCGVDADTEMAAPQSWCITHSPAPKPAKNPAPEAAVTKAPKSDKRADKKAREEAGLAAANEAIKNSRKGRGA